MPAVLGWSRTPPTEPGFYHARHPKRETLLVAVWWKGDMTGLLLLSQDSNGVFYHMGSTLHHAWARQYEWQPVGPPK